jgi:ferredoxin-NADP reductase
MKTLLYHPYILTQKYQQTPDIYTLQFSAKRSKDHSTFLPGQYCYIQHSPSSSATEAHAFSFASSPSSPYLEFCIRVYGPWTQALATKEIGETIYVSDPLGTCTYSATYKNIIFLAGGVGISSILSMLRFIDEQKISIHAYLFYGNRTPETIVYKKDIERLEDSIKTLKIIHIFSEEKTPQYGYSGFLTKEMLDNAIEMPKKYDFFISGPPIFITHCRRLVESIGILPNRIHDELNERAKVE